MTSCESCGSTKLRNVDGLFYCEVCGTQSQILREFETELDHFSGYQSLIRPAREKKPKKRKASFTKSNVIKHCIRPDIDYPRYLRAVGERLATASYLISKIAIILRNDFGLPSELVNTSLSLFQNYLSTTGVAFTDDEIASETNAYVFQRRKTIPQLQLERKLIAQTLKHKRQSEVKIDCSQLPQWQQSYLEESDDNNEDEVFEENLANVSLLDYVNTGLSKRACKMGSLIILNIDLLLCIIYLACQYVKCNWILLTDLHRWHREDRFKIEGRHLLRLNVCVVSESKTFESECYLYSKKVNLPLTNACDLYRALSFFIQTVQLPKTLHIMPFEKVLHRLVFDLNLPACFWSRLSLVLKILPIVTCTVDSDYLRQSCHFLSGDALFERLLSSNGGKKGYFTDAGFYRRITSNQKDVLAMIPIETKAAAVIMLTLKLIFGLDDETEFEIDYYSGTEINSFKFMEWLCQVEFRNCARNGIVIEDILSHTFTHNQLLQNDKVVTSLALPGRIYKPSNELWSVPKRTQQASSQKPFYKCFPVDHPKHSGTDSDLARFAPLRFHGKLGLKVNLNGPKINQKRFSIYQHEFNKTEMDFTTFDRIERPHLPEHLILCDQEWRRQFPALSKFKYLPNDTRISYWFKGKPLLQTRFMNYRLRDESRTFSESFERLLSAMALLISEKAEVLYLVYNLVESMFLSANPTGDSEEQQPRTVSPGLVAEQSSTVDPAADDEFEVASKSRSGSDGDGSDISSDLSETSDEGVVDEEVLRKRFYSNESAFMNHLLAYFW